MNEESLHHFLSDKVLVLVFSIVHNGYGFDNKILSTAKMTVHVVQILSHKEVYLD